MIFPGRAFFVRDFQTIDRHECEEEKTAGKRNANFLRVASCASLELSLASNPESRPAALVMVVTDF